MFQHQVPWIKRTVWHRRLMFTASPQRIHTQLTSDRSTGAEMYQQQCRCNGPRGCVSSGVTKEAFVLVCFDALPPLWTVPKVMFCCIVPCLGVYYGSFYPEAGLDQTFITSPKKGIFHSPLSEHQVINNYCMFWFLCSKWSLCNWSNEDYCNGSFNAQASIVGTILLVAVSLFLYN